MEYEIQHGYHSKGQNKECDLALFVDLVIVIDTELEDDGADNKTDGLDADDVDQGDAHGDPDTEIFLLKKLDLSLFGGFYLFTGQDQVQNGQEENQSAHDTGEVTGADGAVASGGKTQRNDEKEHCDRNENKRNNVGDLLHKTPSLSVIELGQGI